MIKQAIKKVMSKIDLSSTEMEAVMNQIMSGGATDAQIGSFLTALAIKKETIEEITGAAKVMRQKAVKVNVVDDNIIDTCGTGGDGTQTFNISTAAAFVAAGAGISVAKHGNRSVSSSCGSADVLKALGVNININSEKMSECIKTTKIGFLYAPLLHGAMKYAINPRKEIGVRTIFNILGPLTNPAGAKRQLLGVFNPDLTETLATVLNNMGSTHVMVVHGSGADELVPFGKTKVSELKNNTIKNYEIDGKALSFKCKDINELQGGNDSEDNAKIILDILKGLNQGPKKEAVLLNSAAAIYVAGKSDSLENALALAEKSITEKAGLEVLNELIELSNKI